MARKRDHQPELDDAVEPDPSVDGEVEETEGRGRGKRKRATHAITDIGVELVKLGADQLDRLPLPDALRDAIREAQRLTSFGAQRRQALYIGRLMRKLDEDTLAALRSAVQVDRARAARETAALHRAERWRDDLVADDGAFERWVREHPHTDAQQLRALIRQARKDARPEPAPGDAPRQGRAYRQIFALVRAALSATSTGDAAGQ